MSLGIEPIDRFAIFSYLSVISSVKDDCSLESDRASLILNFITMIQLLFSNWYFTNIIVLV